MWHSRHFRLLRVLGSDIYLEGEEAQTGVNSARQLLQDISLESPEERA